MRRVTHQQLGMEILDSTQEATEKLHYLLQYVDL